LFGETKRFLIAVRIEIVMVWLQGDFAKPPEKQFNYKNCFDALFRVCLRLCLSTICVVTYTDVEFRAQMVCEEGPSSLTRNVGPNIFRMILMNASQLASYALPLSLSRSHTHTLSLV
jgi:dicarboxylate transporter 10